MRPKKKHSVLNQLLIDARHACGWSQQDVADKIGVSYTSVFRWEQGLSKPHLYNQHNVCRLFGKSEEALGFAPPCISGIAAASQPPPLGLFPRSPHVQRGELERDLAKLHQSLQNGESVESVVESVYALTQLLVHDPVLPQRSLPNPKKKTKRWGARICDFFLGARFRKPSGMILAKVRGAL